MHSLENKYRLNKIRQTPRSRKSNSGLTFVEILVVLVVFGIAIALFQTVFATNMSAFDEHIIRANLWQEANELFERLTTDARLASDIIMPDPNGSSTAQLLDPEGNLIGNYSIMNDGRVLFDTGSNTVTMCENVDADKSVFKRNGRALVVDLVLTQGSLSRPVTISVTTEIFPRNN
ncbi:MAG: type II secretion system protein [Candidatus Omnitrophica bacterium]|nr:type II secretion system protein [Candidatus Omnitrophota bacterium]